MSFSRKFCSLLILIFCLTTVIFAQSKQAEKRLSDSGNGYSFVLPTNFESQQSNEGFALVNADKSLIVAVKSHSFKSFEEFARQSNLEKDGFALVGEVQNVGDTGKTFLAAKQTAQGVLLVDTFVMFSPYSGGTIIAVFSDKANNQKGFQTGLQIAKSLSFNKIEVSDIAKQWQSFFGGKQLIYLYTSSGFSERTDIILCSSGSFFYRSDSSSLSTNGSGAAAANSDGSWKVSPSGTNLILQFNNGATRDYRISRRQASNEIGLNGNRYFIQTQNQCR